MLIMCPKTKCRKFFYLTFEYHQIKLIRANDIDHIYIYIRPYTASSYLMGLLPMITEKGVTFHDFYEENEIIRAEEID